MTQEAELRYRCQKMADMFNSEAFQFFEAEFLLEITKATKKGKEAVDSGKTEAAAYAMAQIVALDRFFIVKEAIFSRFNSFIDSEKAKQDEKEMLNA